MCFKPGSCVLLLVKGKFLSLFGTDNKVYCLYQSQIFADFCHNPANFKVCLSGQSSCASACCTFEEKCLFYLKKMTYAYADFVSILKFRNTKKCTLYLDTESYSALLYSWCCANNEMTWFSFFGGVICLWSFKNTQLLNLVHLGALSLAYLVQYDQ